MPRRPGPPASDVRQRVRFVEESPSTRRLGDDYRSNMSTLRVRKVGDGAHVRAMGGVVTGVSCTTEGDVRAMRVPGDLDPADGARTIARLERHFLIGGTAVISWNEYGERKSETVKWL